MVREHNWGQVAVHLDVVFHKELICQYGYRDCKLWYLSTCPWSSGCAWKYPAPQSPLQPGEVLFKASRTGESLKYVGKAQRHEGGFLDFGILRIVCIRIEEGIADGRRKWVWVLAVGIFECQRGTDYQPFEGNEHVIKGLRAQVSLESILISENSGIPVDPFLGTTCRVNKPLHRYSPTTAQTGPHSEKEESFPRNQDVYPATTLGRLVFWSTPSLTK